jgi:hypothetical protein
MGEQAREINERIDRAVARELAAHRTWEHPRWSAHTLVRIDEAITHEHLLHPLAGKVTRVCHGNAEQYPGVPCELPGETNLQDEYTTGNFSIVPEWYVSEVRG